MRGGVLLVNLVNHKIFLSNIATLKSVSQDKHDLKTAPEFMTESMCQVIDFDAVKEEYIKKLRLAETPSSNDALFICENGRLVFIEFKNGYMDKKKQFEVQKKIYDSILIFSDITDMGISFTRDQMDYILVYNEIKNSVPPVNLKTHVRDSKSRDQIAKEFSCFGHRPYIKFGLEIFKNYCFNSVHTYTEKEFNEHFIKNIELAPKE